MGSGLKGLAAGLAGVAVLIAGLAATETYAGRLLRLWGPDVEDYRRLPTRAVAAGPAAPMPEGRDPQWPNRVGLVHQGVDLRDPAALDRFLAENGTTAFVLLADGALVDERYYAGSRRDSMFKSFSITKSLLSAAFGIAEAEGLISSDDPLGRHLSGLAEPLAGLPIRHLLDNTAGFAYERGNLPWKQQPRMYYTTDARAYVRGAARFEHPPGTRYVGEDLSPLLVGAALEQAVRRRYPGATLSSYVSRRLWQPLGAAWPALFTLDRAGDGLEKVESGFTARALDLARFGQLYLDGGRVGVHQVVPAAWVSKSITPPPRERPNAFPHGFHRNLWWGHYQPGRTRTDFYANGHFGQRIYVSPDKRLVLVRLGKAGGKVDWTAFLAGIASQWPAPGTPAPDPRRRTGASGSDIEERAR